MDAFNDGIGLGIASGDELPLDTVLFCDGFRDFRCELLASIHANLRWPWISCQPYLFQDVGNIVGLFDRDLRDLKPSSSWIYHCQAMKRDIGTLLLTAEGVRTDKVNAQDVPWDNLRSLRRWLPMLLMVSLADLGCHRT